MHFPNNVGKEITLERAKSSLSLSVVTRVGGRWVQSSPASVVILKGVEKELLP